MAWRAEGALSAASCQSDLCRGLAQGKFGPVHVQERPEGGLRGWARGPGGKLLPQLTGVAQSLNEFGGCENEERIGSKIGEADTFACVSKKWDKPRSGFFLGRPHPRCSVTRTESPLSSGGNRLLPGRQVHSYKTALGRSSVSVLCFELFEGH